MQCLICKNGETEAGKTTVFIQRGDTIVIFKEVPADICDCCGEYYLSAEITEKVMERAETAVRNGAEVEIQRFAA